MSTPSLAILGCGTLGTAILCGVLDTLSTTKEIPASMPRWFTALVQRDISAERIRNLLPLDAPVEVLVNQNLAGVQSADIVLLGCKPYMVSSALATTGMYEALKGKLLISICAGVKITDIQTLVPESCRVVRVMPNTAAKLRESMTVISAAGNVSEDEKNMVGMLFEGVGKTLVLDEKHMDLATSLCGSGPAFYALMLEAMADGGVLMGVPRKEATLMAAQTMMGTAKMVLEGQHPAILREQVSTPGGCTVAGLAKLEDHGVRGVIARTIQTAAEVAGGLGKK
ncbi:pyrroline-5-carboxylate reductase dimerization-domain-containing protein [Pyronema omphalodes]|nr:pyrroline-5-carboxylate reductase dimerization-domain-containing protein [Pyronema omphalodes]